MQQLGRGMRKCEGKEYLMVFDFIDNANMFNTPYSINRLQEYRPGQMVLAPQKQMELDRDLLAKGEKPEIEFVEFNKHVLKKLTKEDISWIKKHCDEKLEAYYGRYI